MERLAVSGRTWSTASRSSTRRCSPCGPWRGRRPPWRRRSRTCSSGWPRCAERRRRRPAAVDGLHRAAGRPAPPPRRPPRPAAVAMMPKRPRHGRLPRRPRRAMDSPKAQVKAEIATVPEPQKPIAEMLPLGDLPPGWTLGKLGERHLETFNADNLFEKIDGRAESFIEYERARGWRTPITTRPATSRTTSRSTSSRWATRSRRWASTAPRSPRSSKPLTIGSDGYASAGSTIFYSGPYYTQVVTTSDNPKFAGFALELARRIAAKQKPRPQRLRPSAARPPLRPNLNLNLRPPGQRRRPRRVRGPADGARTGGGSGRDDPEALFALLPAGPGKASPKYVAQDAFGYSFLSDVFMADYRRTAPRGRGSSAPTATGRRPRPSSRSTWQGPRWTAPRSRRSRPRGRTA